MVVGLEDPSAESRGRWRSFRCLQRGTELSKGGKKRAGGKEVVKEAGKRGWSCVLPVTCAFQLGSFALRLLPQ